MNFRSKNFHATLKCPKVSCKKYKIYRNNHQRYSVKKGLKILLISQKATVLESHFDKIAGLQGNYIKKRIQHRYFEVSNTKFLRKPILKNTA